MYWFDYRDASAFRKESWVNAGQTTGGDIQPILIGAHEIDWYFIICYNIAGFSNLFPYYIISHLDDDYLLFMSTFSIYLPYPYLTPNSISEHHWVVVRYTALATAQLRRNFKAKTDMWHSAASLLVPRETLLQALGLKSDANTTHI